jgi:hypothetical protein
MLYEMGGDETSARAFLIAFITKNNILNFVLTNSDECFIVSK